MDISIPIVGFIFVCIIFPHIVKNKPQFYMAFAVTLLILVLDVILAIAAGSSGFMRFILVLRGILWIVDFVVLVLATGGLSLHELSGELGNAFEVMRRGDTTKTIIVPLTGEQPKSADEAAADRAARAAAAARAKTEEGNRSIPLE